jgi:hypothetical protein
MKQCWDFDSKNRPQFSEITEKLNNFAKTTTTNYQKQNQFNENNILNTVPNLLNVKNEIELEEKFSKLNCKDENLNSKDENLKIEKEKINEKDSTIIIEKNLAIFDSSSYLMKIDKLFKIKFFIYFGKKKG